MAAGLEKTGAKPGDVLSPSTVKDLVAGSGLVFSDRDQEPLRLNGLDGEWRLYSVAHR